jgi:predicted DNA-binding protein YlxM (UPF0122 family)
MTYEDCAAAGLSQAETARRMNVSREAVRQYAKRHSLDFQTARQRGVPYAGHDSMSEAARAEGVTPQAIFNRVVRSSNG